MKVHSKAMTNRTSPVPFLKKKTSPVGHRLFSPCQFAFVKCRFILESVVTTHDAIHEVHKSGIVLKLDYE